MLGRQSTRRRPWCHPKTVSYTLIIILLGVLLLGFLDLQKKGKAITQLTAALDAAERRRGADENLCKEKVAQADAQASRLEQEKNESAADRKSILKKLKEAQQGSSSDLAAKLKAAEEKLAATEKEVKEATVKAGSCQQEFNSLNAEYATMKQGLANLGLSSKTVDKKSEGTITEGALDPRGGMEAALVLKENSQQPWDHGTSAKLGAGDAKDGGALKAVEPHILSGDGSRKVADAVAGQEQPLLQAKTAATR